MLFEEHARGPRVVLADRRAIRRGIRPGMPLAEARALAGSPSDSSDAPRTRQETSEVLFLQHEPEVDLQKLEELRQFCLQFSPVVALAPGACPDALLLDMTGCERLYGSDYKMVQKIGGALQRRGYIGRLALADTPLAARALARLTDPVPPAADFLDTGRIALSARGRPNTPAIEWVIASPGHLHQITRYLPVDSLELPQSILDQLRSLGIHRVHQLISLPRTSLQERFGTVLLDQLDRLLGLKDEELVSPDDPVQISDIWQFDVPTDNAELIQYVVEHLLRRVTRSLRERHLGTLHLVLTLYFEALPPREMHISIFHPTCSYEHLRDLVQLQLDGLQLNERVTGVRIEAVDLAPLTVRQRSLFPALIPEGDTGRFSVLAERLANRIGPENVLLVQEVPDPVPEHAVRYAPFGSSRPSPRRTNPQDAPQQTSSLPPRPLRLLAKPEAITIERTTLHGFPVTFLWRGKNWHARQFGEPERIEGGWWRGKTVRRDYFQLECTNGALLWVFRDSTTGKWFVHGVFE